MASADKSTPNENLVILAARIVREYYYPDQTGHSPDWILVLAIREILKSHPKVTADELFDLLITDSKLRSRGDLSKYLIKSVTHQIEPSRSSIFSGSREFSFEKLSAMVSLLTPRGQGICRTKLNYLLFYSDFTHFFIYGSSISGAKYVRSRGGPFLYRFDALMSEFEMAGIIRIGKSSSNRIVRTVQEAPAGGQLSFFELVTMHWVNTNFGAMTISEITEYARRQVAHRFTRQDDFIAYEYARLLHDLPKKMDLRGRQVTEFED